MKTSVALTGTETGEAKTRVLKAGLLEATFDAGALRWIRWDGVEILRAIMFLVRTPGWGTPAPVIGKLVVEEQASSFDIRYDAYYGEINAGVLVRIRLKGRADGHLKATAEIRSDVPFDTNRTGFVILHPLAGFAGTEVEVEHASGPSRNPVIPLAISPGQPMMDIRAITHSPREGLRVSTRLDGDVFEMEDHRNWSDASFKTYSRPIGLPYPYVLHPAEPVTQSVTVTVSDNGNRAAVADPVAVPPLDRQVIPAYALPLDRPEDVGEALRFASALADIRPARILLHYDPSRGDTTDGFDRLAELLKRTGASLEVQALLAGDDAEVADAALAELSQALARAGIRISHISAFAKIDEQSFQPGEARPPHLSEQQLAAALARAFPDSIRGGGSPAFFTEFNRKRPDPALAGFLTFATTPVVHAADDASVAETLQSLPHILHSAQALSGGVPISIGPVGIGARLNPYGPAPSDNRPEERVGMAARDPRQRGLFAAAWHVGYLARLAPWGVERFAFGAATGPFGLVSSRQAYARTSWDEWPEGALYPLYHVSRWISNAAGGGLIAASTDGNIARVEWEKDGKHAALFANLGPEPVTFDLEGYPEAKGRLLDEANLETAALRPEAFAAVPLEGQVQLGAYAVLNLEYGVSK